MPLLLPTGFYGWGSHQPVTHKASTINEHEKKAIDLPLIHRQGIICGVVFDRSSLRRIPPYASVVAPRRLASNTLLVIRHNP